MLLLLVARYSSLKKRLRGSDYFQATVSPPSAAPPHSAALFTVTPMQSDKVEQKRKSFSVKPPKNVQSCKAALLLHSNATHTTVVCVPKPKPKPRYQTTIQ